MVLPSSSAKNRLALRFAIMICGVMFLLYDFFKISLKKLWQIMIYPFQQNVNEIQKICGEREYDKY